MEKAEVKGLDYADRCMALVDVMREMAAEDPALFLLLAMYGVLEK
jgi:hypothetical protein